MKIDFGDLDPKVMRALAAQGGKKQVDALLVLFKENAPLRAKEIASAPDLAEAQDATKALGRSAKILGLVALETACDEIASLKSWSTPSPQAVKISALVPKAIAALEKLRKNL